MKKVFTFISLIFLFLQGMHSQNFKVWMEDFDSTPISYTPTKGSWSANTIYTLPGSSSTNPKSYRGILPNIGDTAILLSASYDFQTNMYSSVQLRFSHICKVSPNDKARIQYRRSGESVWYTIDRSFYDGNAANYALDSGFNAASYPQWRADDSTMQPTQSWWKEEVFDLTSELGYSIAEIRFILIKSSVQGSQVSYGWLLENIEMTAAKHTVKPPVVEFIAPYPQDTVYITDHREINAKVKSTTQAKIEIPWLVYTVTKNGIPVKTESMQMTNVSGDSLWRATIEQLEVGSDIRYHITGRDTNGNNKTVYEYYFIRKPAVPTSDNIIIGTGTSVSPHQPYHAGSNTGWSRSIYMDWEFDAVGRGALIESVAYYNTLSVSSTVDNLSMYFKAVDDTIIDATLDHFVDPIADGATLVWGSATSSFSGAGWKTFTLHSPFHLPAGKNLMIYWTNQDGSRSGNGTISWRYTTANNKNIRAYQDLGNWPPTNSLINGQRPNAQFSTLNAPELNHSAAMLSINISDTIATAPAYYTPINLTLRNKGEMPLDSITISYNLNNGVVKDTVVRFSPALSWGFTAEVKVGDYLQRKNEFDTIVAWVSFPNSASDLVTSDDTLTKIVYGANDFLAAFVDYVTDTVFNTGPFIISASILPVSANTTLNNVSLYVKTTLNAVTKYDTLPMALNPTTTLWEATIPQTQSGSDVAYKIELIDFLGNTILLADSFHIKFKPESEYVIVGTGTSNGNTTPIGLFYAYGWSRMLYLGTELLEGNAKGTITKLAWDYTSISAWNSANQTCYFKVVDETSLSSNNYLDPIADGATEVWQGSIGATGAGWVEIELDNPFTLPSGKNLLIYWNNQQGARAGTSNMFNHHGATNMTAFGTSLSDWSGATASASYTLSRPNARFYIGVEMPEGNLVSLVSVDSPSKGVVAANTTIPVTVIIRNEGLNALSSCKIQWTKNGILQPSTLPSSIHTPTTPIPLRFTDTITIGYYTPNVGDVDDIVVWVELPNNTMDSFVDDDMLQVNTVACGGQLSGEYTIGSSSADYVDIASVFFQLEQCGMSGKVTLQLEDGTYSENIDFSKLSGKMTSVDTLEIVSLSRNAANVTLKPLSEEPVLLLSSVNNIIVNALTIDATVGNSHVFEFTGACTNIVVTNCTILLDAVKKNAFHKTSGTGALNGLTVTNCTISGGAHGIYMSLIASDRPGVTNVIIDNNIFSGQYTMGIYFNYANAKSISYNKITSHSSQAETTWYGINMSENRTMPKSVIIGNSIYSNNTAITSTLCGIRTYNTDSLLVANNEINLNSSASTAYGIYIDSPKDCDYLYNTVLLTGIGSSAFRALHWQTYANTNYNATVSNNIFVANGGNAARAIYLSTNITSYQSNYRINNNNYFSSGSLGHHGTVQATLGAWQSSVTMDANSVNILPSFTNPALDLSLSNYQGLLFPLHSGVLTDITGATRPAQTAVGAYSQPLASVDFWLRDIASWNDEFIENQQIDVAVEMINLGSTPIDRVVFGWTLNGQSRPSVVRTISPSLASFEQRTISVSSFIAADATAFDVVVWVDTVNTIKNTVSANDTVSASTSIRPLVEFVAPFTADTIYNRTFSVNALIRTLSGAPTTPPFLDITSTVNGQHVTVVAVPMTLTNGTWQATIPEQYYGTMVVYSLTVSDAIDNTSTIVDSTYIQFPIPDDEDTKVVIGTGTSTNGTNPYAHDYNFSFSRNYYMDYEIVPNRKGGEINSISFYNASTSKSNVDNVSFYLKAVSDSIVSSNAYIDPIADGATLVWGPARSSTNGTRGWVTFELDAPFHLPPSMNLLVYCNSLDGSWMGNGIINWQYTAQNKNTSLYVYGDESAFPPTTSVYLNGNRPNLQIGISIPSDLYPGHDLAILSMTEPISNLTELCLPDSMPVKVAIANRGEEHYDFMVNPAEIEISVVDLNGGHYHTTHILNIGGLMSGTIDTIEIMSAFPVMSAGSYDMVIWVNSSVDSMPYDDTLRTSCVLGRVSLPVDENFNSNTMPVQFVSTPIIGTSVWKVLSEDEASIQPHFSGTGMIMFDGTIGAISVLSTRQLDLYQTSNPYLEFWYYHDATLSEDNSSSINVNVLQNGVSTNLGTITCKDIVSGWQSYRFPLDDYTSVKECILIQFEAMNRSNGAIQYIDRILITSDVDVAVSEIFITPQPNICDMKNKDVFAVIQTKTNQSIDFIQNPTSIELEINGTTYPAYSLQQRGVLRGNSSDTVLIASNVAIPVGAYTIKAYLTQVVDNASTNDTAKYFVDINPRFNAELIASTDAISSQGCFSSGTLAEQRIRITNTGTVELSNIVMFLEINEPSVSCHITMRDTLAGVIPAGGTEIYTFKEKYIVPAIDNYTVGVIAHLECDSAMANSITYIPECVNIDDLYIVDIIHPTGTGFDKVGDVIKPIVSVGNHCFIDFEDVEITALIVDMNGKEQGRVEETIPQVNMIDTLEYIFTKGYTVPEMINYKLIVYFNSVDNYLSNDTMFIYRMTDYVGIKDMNSLTISMEQNIPNPTNNSTIIKYSVPQSGEVSFKIYSVNGQILYNNVENVQLGDNQIEINTSTFAAGIYFYTMEFEGQRITRRMSKQ